MMFIGVLRVRGMRAEVARGAGGVQAGADGSTTAAPHLFCFSAATAVRSMMQAG